MRVQALPLTMRKKMTNALEGDRRDSPRPDKNIKTLGGDKMTEGAKDERKTVGDTDNGTQPYCNPDTNTNKKWKNGKHFWLQGRGYKNGKTKLPGSNAERRGRRHGWDTRSF